MSRARKAWLASEKKTLVELWGTVEDEDAARRLGRTVGACHTLANLLRLRKRDAILTPGGLGRLIGAHPNTVTRWCRTGLIKAEHSVIHAGRNSVWSIDPSCLDHFLAGGWVEGGKPGHRGKAQLVPPPAQSARTSTRTSTTTPPLPHISSPASSVSV